MLAHQRNLRYYVGGTLLLAASLAVRYAALPIVIADYNALSNWFLALQSHPALSAFAAPFSDYAPLYLYFLKLLTFVPVRSLYSIKALSTLFDVLMAAGVYAILKIVTPLSRAQRFFAFAIVLCIPTVVINSGVWAQSDATYTALLIVSLAFMLAENPFAAAVSFGIAISFKLQAIFFLPVLAGFLLRSRRTWPYLFAVPLTYVLSVVPAWIGGGNLWQLLTIYAQQAHEYHWLNAFSPNVFAYTTGQTIAPGVQTVLAWTGVGVAGLCAIAIAVLVARTNFDNRPSTLVYLSLLDLVLVPFFLPRMHERYFYSADVLSVLYAMCRPRHSRGLRHGISASPIWARSCC